MVASTNLAGKRLGVLDLGSNTFKLLVADITPEGFDVVYERSEYCRLGEGLFSTGNLSDEAIARSMQTLSALVGHAAELNTTTVCAVGTSALRASANSSTFLDRARNEHGLNIQVLSGEEEAALVFRGVCSDPQLSGRELLVMDLGGGSAEWILGNRHAIANNASLDIGCVRMTERFFPGQLPPPTDGVRQLEAHLEMVLSPILEKFPLASRTLVGTGGTLCCLACVMQPTFWDIMKTGGSFSSSRAALHDLTHLLLRRTLEELVATPGIPAKRADVIVAGAIIFRKVFAMLNADTFFVSNRGLRYGLMDRLAQAAHTA